MYQRAFSLGANAYLNKPVDPKTLLKEIGSLLQMRSSGQMLT